MPYIDNKGVPNQGIHAQQPFLNWPNAAGHMRAGTWVKVIDNVQMLDEAKRRFPTLNTLMRHFDGGWQRFEFPSHTERRQHVRAFLESFVDGTFRNLAHNVDAIEGWNEYNASSHNATEVAQRVEIVRAFCQEWASMKAEDRRLEKIRMVLGNVAVGNDLPLEAAQIIALYGNIAGYHPYIPFRHPSKMTPISMRTVPGLPKYNAVTASMRSGDLYHLDVTYSPLPSFSALVPTNSPTNVMLNEWPWLSGRWTEMDKRFRAAGITLQWLGTEGGPINYYDWGGLDPMGGWRHPDCCAGDMELYLQALDYWMTKTLQWNAANGNRMLGVTLYNSGGTSEWSHFETNTDQHTRIAQLMQTYQEPVVEPPPPPPPPVEKRSYKKVAHLVKRGLPDYLYKAIYDHVKERGESIFNSADDWAQPAKNTDLVTVTEKQLITWNIDEYLGLPLNDAIKAIENFALQYYPEPIGKVTFAHNRIGALFAALEWQAPVGTRAERASKVIWPGRWIDANPFLSRYDLGYHTGADLNLNDPTIDFDRNKPVYTAASGKVTYAGKFNEAWQGIVVVRHQDVGGSVVCYSRYAHLQPDEIFVQKDQWVKVGDMLGLTGRNMTNTGPGPYHVHFDISTTAALANNPGDWPGFDLARVRRDYVDPKAWLLARI